MTNTNNLLNESGECFSAEMQEWIDKLFPDDSKLKFKLITDLSKQPKRGQLSTTTSDSDILEFYQYICRILEQKLDVVLPKTCYFSVTSGVASFYISSKKIVKNLIQNTLKYMNSDEELSKRSVNDFQTSFESTLEDDIDSFTEADFTVSRSVGTVESVFRENHGVPKQNGFVPKAVAKIHLNDLNYEVILESIGESRYVWIQHFFQNSWTWENQNMKDDLKASETSQEELLEPLHYLSLAQVDKIEGKTIWISGAKILHNAIVTDIQTFNSKSVLESSKISNIDNFHQKVLEKISTTSEEDFSLEDFVNESIEAFFPNMKAITYTDSVMKELSTIVHQNKLDFYTSTDEVISAINMVLSMDPVCLKTQTKNLLKNISAISLDNLMIIFEQRGNSVLVFKIVWGTHFIETKTQHSKDWLDSVSDVLNLEKLLASN